MLVCTLEYSREKARACPCQIRPNPRFNAEKVFSAVCMCRGKAFRWCLKLAVLDVILWGVLFALDCWVEHISRRACNAPYVIWMLAYNLLLVLMCAAVQFLVGGDSEGPVLLEAVNNNMMAVFLIANVLTGAVNLLVDTLQVGAWASRGVVLVYMAVVCGAAVGLERTGVKLKIR